MLRADGRRRGDRGQSTPLVMACLFSLTLFTAVVVNVGQAVNRRIALQLVADTGAFTGASTMAAGLNGLAYWNGMIQEIWAPMTWVSAGFIFSPLNCGTNESAAGLYDTGRELLGALIRMINYGYAPRAQGEARRVSDYNAADLFPGERLSYSESEWSAEVPIRIQRNPLRLFNLEEVPEGTAISKKTLVPPFFYGAGAKYTVTWGCVPESIFRWPWTTHSFRPWFRRTPDSKTAYFVWIVKSAPVKAIMFNDFFTRLTGEPYAIPAMTAAAAAKPVGGSIEKGDAKYIVKMVPLSKVIVTGPLSSIYDTVVGKWRRVRH